MKKIKLKCNKRIGIHEAGKVIELNADENGTPTDKFWRDRLNESEIDNCVSVVTSGKKSEKKGEDEK